MEDLKGKCIKCGVPTFGKVCIECFEKLDTTTQRHVLEAMRVENRALSKLLEVAEARFLRGEKGNG